MKTHGTTAAIHVIPGKTYTKVVPFDMSGYTATGEVTTSLYEGSWEACVNEAVVQCADGSHSLQVSANVVGDAAGMAKLTVTRSVYVSSFSGSGSGSGSSGLTAGTAGDSEDNPTYSFDVSSNAVSILLHPTVQNWLEGASSAEKTALQALVNGAQPCDWIALGKGSGVTKSTIEDILGGSSTVMNFVLKNPPQFYSFSMVMRATYKVNPASAASAVSGIGKIADPPGPYSGIKFGKNRNFLYIGASYQTVGDVTTCTKSYLLSEEGGWPSDIYGAG